MLLSAPLAACGNTASGLTFDRRWVGTVTPQDPASCGAPTQATLTRRGDAFTFTPNDGAIILTGTVGPDGHLQATLPLVGADHHPFPLVVDGTLGAAGFEGTYSSPRCRSRVTLHPPA